MPRPLLLLYAVLWPHARCIHATTISGVLIPFYNWKMLFLLLLYYINIFLIFFIIEVFFLFVPCDYNWPIVEHNKNNRPKLNLSSTIFFLFNTYILKGKIKSCYRVWTQSIVLSLSSHLPSTINSHTHIYISLDKFLAVSIIRTFL
jgi:hypothetical protein